MGLNGAGEAAVIRMGAWEAQIRGPARLVRDLRAVLSGVEIREPDLPALEITVDEAGLARGRAGGAPLWAHPLPRRGGLPILVGYVVASATALLRASLYAHAGVVEVDGRATILVGPPGAGKTSIVGMLLRRGARFLSDEVALIDPAAGAVLPFGLPLAVKPWTAQAMGALPAGTIVALEAGVRYLRPALRAGAAPIDRVVLLDPSSAASTPVEVPRAEALLAIGGQASSFRHAGRVEAAFAGFMRVLRRARCCRVGSAVPAEAARMLARGGRAG